MSFESPGLLLSCVRGRAGRLALTMLVALTAHWLLACANPEPAPPTGGETQQDCGKEILIDRNTAPGTHLCVKEGGQAEVKNLLACELTFGIPHLGTSLPVPANQSRKLQVPPVGEYRYAVTADCHTPTQVTGPLQVQSN